MIDRCNDESHSIAVFTVGKGILTPSVSTRWWNALISSDISQSTVDQFLQPYSSHLNSTLNLLPTQNSFVEVKDII